MSPYITKNNGKLVTSMEGAGPPWKQGRETDLDNFCQDLTTYRDIIFAPDD